MELLRYADRPDLRELRRAALNEFPEFMNHNAMGWKYWGRLYDEFPEFQLALLDGGELVAEVHALSVPVEGRSCRRAGTRRSSAGWRPAAATCSRCSRSASLPPARRRARDAS